MAKIKGYLVAIGGAEDKGVNYKQGAASKKRFDFFEEGILRRIITLVAQHGIPKIELITTASSFPEQMEISYRDAFLKLGCMDVEHLFITSREQVDTAENLDRINECNCVIFTGGDQLRLSSIFGGTKLMERIRSRYLHEAFVVAGTSAGAMAMGGTMIYDGNATRAHLKGEIKFTTGFNLISNVIIDTHFEKRGRFNRLAQAVAVQPGILGIGLAEDTGIIISGGNKFLVIGSGIVTVLNGKTISYTNLPEIEDRMPISVEHIIVHILSGGDVYNLASQQVERPFD
ncbi:cyanophycinase [Flavitalea sp.]|nr:cyanophycinase [Flavitalea sp.]